MSVPDRRAAGQVVAGNVGARNDSNTRSSGHRVSEAARLSELARSEPGRVLATESTIAAASPQERASGDSARPFGSRGYDDRIQIAGLANAQH